MKLKQLLATIVLSVIICLIWFSNTQTAPSPYTPLVTKQSATSLPQTVIHSQSVNAATPSRLKFSQANLLNPIKTHVKVDIPPISPSKIENEYTGDLDDHDAYLAYEKSREIAIKSAYIKAAKDKVKLLNIWLAKGINQQVDASQIEFAKEKIKALEQLSQSLEEELKKAS